MEQSGVKLQVVRPAEFVTTTIRATQYFLPEADHFFLSHTWKRLTLLKAASVRLHICVCNREKMNSKAAFLALPNWNKQQQQKKRKTKETKKTCQLRAQSHSVVLNSRYKVHTRPSIRHVGLQPSTLSYSQVQFSSVSLKQNLLVLEVSQTCDAFQLHFQGLKTIQTLEWEEGSDDAQDLQLPQSAAPKATLTFTLTALNRVRTPENGDVVKTWRSVCISA